MSKVVRRSRVHALERHNMAQQHGSANFIFGYGSLIERASRTSTTPSAWAAYPVIVEGVARGWWGTGAQVGFSTCFLSAIIDPKGRCNGVVYPVTTAELEQTDRREWFYERTALDTHAITFLDGRRSPPEDAKIWVYALKEGSPTQDHRPSAKFPIVQSYVDVCLNGCFEMETLYPLAKEADYARMFVQETRDWGTYWINDRIYPRRSFNMTPRASQIDALLNELLPDLFAKIQLEPAQWPS